MGKLKCLQEQRLKPTTQLIQFNTDTIFDMMVGTYRKNTIDGHWYLDGGLGTLILGMGGRNGSYKTTILLSLMLRVLSIYKECDGTLIDTEYTILRDLERMYRFVGNLPGLEDDITTISGADMDINECLAMIQKIVTEKAANKKEFTITTPFIDTKTNKLLDVWLPSLISIDSYSEFSGDGEGKLVEDEGVTGKKTKTIYMLEGGYKTIFLRTLRRLCERYGLIALTTAHVDENAGIGIAQPRKQMVHMKQSDALKNVGSKYKSLTNPYVSIEGCRLLRESETYPSKHFKNVDLNEVTLKIARSKTNMSGITVPMIVSQTDGVLSPLTDYHYLKLNNYFGLIGSKSNHYCALYPDVKVTRPKVRDLLMEDAKLRRAMQLMSRYLFVKNEWNTSKIPLNFTMSGDEFAERVLNHPLLGAEKVLNSIEYWVPGKQEDNYLSLFDMLEILDAN